MAIGKVALGVLLGALVAMAPGQEARTRQAEAVTSGATSALVLRASAPLSVHEGHGDASFRAHMTGKTWRVALAWSSERGQLRVGAVVAGVPDS